VEALITARGMGYLISLGLEHGTECRKQAGIIFNQQNL
jgi:hypothetical protein